MLLQCAITLPFIGNVNLSGTILVVFLVCLLCVCAFEFVNGFHDTANAVATVIYTNTLKPYAAIVWSGLWNFLGVFVIGTAVAMSLLKLIPIDKLIILPVQTGACLVIAILLASIIWNLGTWYIGLPLSSSHTLVGAMIGAGLGFSYYYGGGLNWDKAKDIGLSLLISPVVGFAGAALLMYIVKHLVRTDKLFHAPQNDSDKPPIAIRALLITTCTLVSFFHGSNDGQKGVGLLMLVLIAFLPATFAFNPKMDTGKLTALLKNTEYILQHLPARSSDQQSKIIRLKKQLDQVQQQIVNKNALSVQQKFRFREQFKTFTATLKSLTPQQAGADGMHERLTANIKELEKATDYAPVWVLATISLSLGLGTMIGWKRIVVTIGERIGNEHLNYAEGASAELTTAATIGISTALGLPVSTTHVLSGGIAGTMMASKGAKNLNYSTVKHIVMAWVLTVPAAIILSFLLFVSMHLLL